MSLTIPIEYHMMTSSNGNMFRFTGPLYGNSPVTGEFPARMPVTRKFDVFFDLRLIKWLGKQSWGWWFETPSRLLWRQCNDLWSSATYISCEEWLIIGLDIGLSPIWFQAII